MNTSDIVRQLDALIARWTEARAIFASMLPEASTEAGEAHTPLAAQSVHAAPDTASALATPEPEPVQVTRLKPRSRRERRTPVRTAATLPTALSSSVPSAPVVVTAVDAARLRQAALEQQPSSGDTAVPAPGPGHSLEDLVRELARRSDSAGSLHGTTQV